MSLYDLLEFGKGLTTQHQASETLTHLDCSLLGVKQGVVEFSAECDQEILCLQSMIDQIRKERVNAQAVATSGTPLDQVSLNLDFCKWIQENYRGRFPERFLA